GGRLEWGARLVGGDQRRPALPIFAAAVGLHNPGARVRRAAARQDAVGRAAYRIEAGRVGERKLVARRQVILVLAGEPAGLREGKISERLARAGQTGDDAVEHHRTVEILVESMPQPSAQKAARL